MRLSPNTIVITSTLKTVSWLNSSCLTVNCCSYTHCTFYSCSLTVSLLSRIWPNVLWMLVSSFLLLLFLYSFFFLSLGSVLGNYNANVSIHVEYIKAFCLTKFIKRCAHATFCVWHELLLKQIAQQCVFSKVFKLCFAVE